MTTKQKSTYSRKDPILESMLLKPTEKDPFVRLGAYKRSNARATSYVINELVEQGFLAEDQKDQALDAFDDDNSRYAGVDRDFNYLAGMLAISPRYSKWGLSVDGLPITPGLYTFFGSTKAGKSTLVDMLALRIAETTKADRVIRLQVGEPGSDLDVFLSMEEVARAVEAARDCVLPPVVILDSLRLTLFDLPGSARSMAISAKLQRFLTEVNNFALGHGICVLAVMNPSSGTEEKIEEFFKDVEASLTCIVRVESGLQGQFAHRSPEFKRVDTPFALTTQFSDEIGLTVDESESGEASNITVRNERPNGVPTELGRTKVQRP